MTEEKQKKLIAELSEALMCINSAQCVFHGEPLTGSKIETQLENIWSSIYKIRQSLKDGLVFTQSKGEPEKTG